LALLFPSTLQGVFDHAVVGALERSGAAFIKWGQWVSTRPDLLPSKLCDALTRLQSGAPMHSFELTRAEVVRSVGEPLTEHFDNFAEQPLASGSIGQVHLATLQGAAVAVKVRHPDVELELQTDFYLMGCAAAFVQRLPGLSWFDAQSTVQQFGLTLVAQVALDDEARHLRQMGHNFRRWSDVGLPRVLFASETVLIQTLAAGVPVSRYTTKEGRLLLSAAQRHLIVRRGVEIYLKMLLQDNLMHADMHPGNILFDAKQSRITLVDTGLVTTLTVDERRNFIGFLQALGDGDGRRAAQCMLGWSSVQAHADEAGFRSEMEALFWRICRGYGSGIHLGDVLRGALELVRRHRVAIGANYMTLVVNALCLEGMARTLEPEYNVMDAAQPLLVTYGKVPHHLFVAVLPALQAVKAASDRTVGRRLLRASKQDGRLVTGQVVAREDGDQARSLALSGGRAFPMFGWR